MAAQGSPAKRVILTASSHLLRTSLLRSRARASDTAGIKAVAMDIVMIPGVNKALRNSTNCPKVEVASFVKTAGLEAQGIKTASMDIRAVDPKRVRGRGRPD